MARFAMKTITRNDIQVEPLATGEIAAEGIDLTVDRSVPLTGFMQNPAVQAGEMSFAQYFRRVESMRSV